MLEVIVIALAFMGLVLQSSFFDHFSLIGVTPDILLTCLVFYAIFKGHIKGTLMGAGLGLIEDLFIGQMIGPMLIGRIIIGFAAGYFARNIFKENYWLPAVILIVATFMSNLMLWLFHSVVNGYISVQFFVKVSFLQSLYNLIFLPFFYVITYHISGKEKRG